VDDADRALEPDVDRFPIFGVLRGGLVRGLDAGRGAV
jgi:hypothetical protein